MIKRYVGWCRTEGCEHKGKIVKVRGMSTSDIQTRYPFCRECYNPLHMRRVRGYGDQLMSVYRTASRPYTYDHYHTQIVEKYPPSIKHKINTFIDTKFRKVDQWLTSSFATVAEKLGMRQT